MGGKRITQASFLERLYEKHGDNFEMLSVYDNCYKKIQARCKLCNFIHDILPHGLLDLKCCYKCIKRKPWNKGIPAKEENKIRISNTLKAKYASGEIIHPKGALGMVHTEEARSKIAIAGTGRPGPWKGKKFPPEMVKKMSGRLGALCPRWKGGVTELHHLIRHSTPYREWRDKIFKRDNFTCVKCNTRGGNKHAHHIVYYSDIIKQYNITSYEDALKCEFLWDIDNGETLCKPCHNKEHYGS